MKRVRSTLLASVIGALVAFVLLVPSGGIDTDPPECHSLFGYVVPCGSGFAGVGALVAAPLLVAGGSVAGRTDRRRVDASSSDASDVRARSTM